MHSARWAGPHAAPALQLWEESGAFTHLRNEDPGCEDAGIQSLELAEPWAPLCTGGPSLSSGSHPL